MNRSDGMSRFSARIIHPMFIGCVFTMVLLSSCARILNSNQTDIHVFTDEPTRVIVKQDSLSEFSREHQISVNRSSDPLPISVYADGYEKSINIPATNSFAYWLNLYPNWLLWTGFLIDRNTPKRYTYPKRVYVDVRSTTADYVTYFPWSRKGQMDLRVSLPYINSFLLTPDHEPDPKLSIGFWGFTAGVDYYHGSQQFISLTFSGVTDFFVPIPAAVDISGEYELMSSTYLSMTNNHHIRQWSVGYGICYAKNIWDLRYYDSFDPPPLSREPVKKVNFAFGFVFPFYYQPGKTWFMGMVYRPTVFRLSETKPIGYEHVISFEFGWQIRLKKSGIRAP